MLTFAQRVGAGLTLGLNAAQIDGDGVGGYNKIGWLFGGYAFYDFNERFSLQPEIQYSQKGSREVMVIPGIHYRFHYIEFPLIFNYNIFPKKTVIEDKLVIQAGPSLGYAFSVIQGFRPGLQNVTSDFKRLDYGIHAGLTYYISPAFGLTFRNSLSFFWINFQTTNARTWPWLHRYFTFGVRIGIK